MHTDLLVERCQRGDSEAFDALLNHHYNTIYHTAFRWCGDQSNAQDITQNVCLKLVHAIGKFGFDASFSTWLYRLTINCAKDFYKSPTQFSRREAGVPTEQLISQQGETTTTAQGNVSERQHYARQILLRITELPPDLADALILVFVEGDTHQQAANKLGIKESTVSWRIHEARKQLKAWVDTPARGNYEPQTV